MLTVASDVIFGNPAGSFFLFLSVLYFCSESNLPASSLYSMAIFLMFSPTPQTITACLVSTLIFAIYLKLMDRNVGIFNIKRFVKSFVLFWLTSSPVYIENALLSVSERKKGKVRCLRIGDAKLVSSDFHPGPFRNVGGATLIEEIRKRGAVYLHSPATHTSNPASRGDVQKILSSIDCESQTLFPMKPFRVESDNFEVVCLPFDKLRVYLVGGKERIDDFTIESGEVDFIVDCHNAHSKSDFDMSKNDIEEIKKLIEKSRKVNCTPTKFKYGFLREEFSSDSICTGIDVLLLDYCEEKYALIVFDSNNVNLKFRKFVEKRLREHGYIPIVASTDNHEKTGIRVKFSYKAAGDDERDWEAFENVIKKIESIKLAEAECSYGEREVEINVMGETFFRDSEAAARKYSGLYITIFLFSLALSFLATGLMVWALKG
jgi:putative membrane protein